MGDMNVRVIPIFEKITIDINIGTGFNCITSHKRIVTGVISSTVVTLSKNDDTSAVNKHKQFIRGHTCPLVIYSNRVKIGSFQKGKYEIC